MEENKIKNNNDLKNNNQNLYSKLKINDEKLAGIALDRVIETCKEYASELICFICSNFLIDPILCDECQIIFCSSCILKWTQDSSGICPKGCKFKQRSISKVIRNLLNKIKLKCKNMVNGCKEILNYDDYFNHLNNLCEYILFQCGSEGCNFTSIEREMIIHVSICEKTKLKCQYCSDCILRCNLRIHEEECCLRIVICHFCSHEVTVKDYKLHEKECEYLVFLCQECRMNVFNKYLINEANSFVFKDKNTLGQSKDLKKKANDEVELDKILEAKNKRILDLEKQISDQDLKIKTLDQLNIDLQVKLENILLNSNSNAKIVEQFNKFDFKDLKDLKNLKDIKGGKEIVTMKIKDEFFRYKQANKEFNNVIGMYKDESKKTGVNCIESREDCKPDDRNTNKTRDSSTADLLIQDHNRLAWKTNIKNISFEGPNKNFHWKGKQFAEYWGPKPFNINSFYHYNLPDKNVEIRVVNDISKEFGKTIGFEFLPQQCGRCDSILDSFSSFMSHLKSIEYIPKNSIINGSPFRYWLFWQNENEFVNFWYDEVNNASNTSNPNNLSNSNFNSSSNSTATNNNNFNLFMNVNEIPFSPLSSLNIEEIILLNAINTISNNALFESEMLKSTKESKDK